MLYYAFVRTPLATLKREMYTQVSEAQNRRDEETDLALPWATCGSSGGATSISAFDVLSPTEEGEGQICELLIVWRFRRSKASPQGICAQEQGD